jgi:hypothetical protein
MQHNWWNAISFWIICHLPSHSINLIYYFYKELNYVDSCLWKLMRHPRLKWSRHNQLWCHSLEQFGFLEASADHHEDLMCESLSWKQKCSTDLLHQNNKHVYTYDDKLMIINITWYCLPMRKSQLAVLCLYLLVKSSTCAWYQSLGLACVAIPTKILPCNKYSSVNT